MAKVEEEVSTARRTPAPTTPTSWRGTPARPIPDPRPQGHFLVRF